jgi:hypothetical protein
VDDLKSGLEAIEERARAELGMVDEYETFYQFVREQVQRESLTADRRRTPANEDGSESAYGMPEIDNEASDGEASSEVEGASR